MKYIYVCNLLAISSFRSFSILDIGKPFTSTMRFGPERSEGPYRMESERFTNILSTWFTQEIKVFVYLSFS